MEVECKVGGRLFPKLSAELGQTEKKYHDGSVKRTLERDLKEPALAEGHAYSMLACEMIAVSQFRTQLWEESTTHFTLHFQRA